MLNILIILQTLVICSFVHSQRPLLNSSSINSSYRSYFMATSSSSSTTLAPVLSQSIESTISSIAASQLFNNNPKSKDQIEFTSGKQQARKWQQQQLQQRKSSTSLLKSSLALLPSSPPPPPLPLHEITKSDGTISQMPQNPSYLETSSSASSSISGNFGGVSLQLPPEQYPLKGQNHHRLSRGRKNSLNALRKNLSLQSSPWYANINRDRQSDDPSQAVDEEIYDDPLQALKKKVKNNNSNYKTFQPNSDNQGQEIEDILGVKCTFETDCAWKWEKDLPDGFNVVTGSELQEQNMTGMMPGPVADAVNNANGHFLHARLKPNMEQLTLISPQFSTTLESCKLEVIIHQSSMSYGLFRIVIEPLDKHENPWVPAEIQGSDYGRWNYHTFRIGRITKDFQIIFEVVPNKLGGRPRGHVSIDNIKMTKCFPEGTSSDSCSISQIKCKLNKISVCFHINHICDITVDCDAGEDELHNCDKIPFGGRCDFENGWCGWHNSGKAILLWSHHSGPTPTERTGPDLDHTYGHTNITGHYMFVNMNQHANDSEKKKLVGFASNAVMNSIVFNPPPSVHANESSAYRNSCIVRFYVHQFGMNAGSINLSVVEMKRKENVTTTLWWSSKNLGQQWVRGEVVLPNITSKYYLQFEARMGMRIYSDVAVDDFSLSPECFGINIPAEHLQGYNYWDPRTTIKRDAHKDFVNKTVLELTTCGTRGIHGPTPSKCQEAYNNTEVLNRVRVIEKSPYKGMQLWKVPNEGYYTIIAKGAGGGFGSGGVGSSRGAIAIAVLELHKNEEIYVLVGQAGENACIKSINFRDEDCENSTKSLNPDSFHSKTHMVKHIVIEDGAGGGGGGSYVFLVNSAHATVPLIVAAGGGGLGIGRFLEDNFQHGRGYKPEYPEESGQVHGDIQQAAGPGGGWKASVNSLLDPRFGSALQDGGRGGLPCYAPRGYHGQGGFGGGGGGCYTGGGGGGYAGGDSYLNLTNGEGGTSYIGIKRSIRELNAIYEAANSGSGTVLIIPAIEGCGCDYLCITVDEFRSTTRCICPDGWKLKRDNNTACEVISDDKLPLQFWIIFFAVITFLLIAALTSLILILYNRYQRKKQAALRHKMLLEQDLQLSRLRNNADDSALTNFNPNYGCDGILNGNVDVKSLPQVARESLRLVKALGQGAFGEVYQGLYRHRDGDAVEMPVAVKTLPEMSTGQAEADFLMEAAIMAKFNHPNIVHLIGVCFDRHPRFIVLELLAGGDLKNFLREGRNKPERPSPLTMKDLVFCALDVAKGCRYMESKRFIHRDIAARNCLLSSKGPGRVVKIADFGMARDIYRSDYYRKGGKAMLPIKWMPPEAFLDGIFTSKTDVWSFGVLLWEVFSLGLMPYTGLPNRDVMQLVTGGGRLDAPPGCPPAVYRIMADCWNPTPEERPSFSSLLERLTACTQDPDVMNAPLPSIIRPPSTERDQTIMRPPGNDDFCLQVPNSSDYLIPLPGPRSAAERLLTEVTGVTISETVTTFSAPVITSPSAPQNKENGECWETSFMMPNSKSNQPLIPTEAQNGLDIMLNHNSQKSNTNELKDEEETKLISLDTPQPTPTAIKPPVSFSQLDGITLDPSALTKNHNTPQTQVQVSYANIQMMNAIKNESNPCSDKMNGNSNSFDGSSSTISANSAPFTIQGFNDRYSNKDNHSEISC